jgi:hypothetical protein
LGWGGWRFPLPFGLSSSQHGIGLELDSVEDEDPSLAILDAFEKNFLREVKVARSKTKVGGRF